MFEFLLNFISGAVVGLIFFLIIMLFMICTRWCRPVPRIPISKNIPPGEGKKEKEETVKWISSIIKSDYFHSSLENQLTETLQEEFNRNIQENEEIKSIVSKVFVNKVDVPEVSFDKVTTVDNGELVVSTFYFKFASEIKIETTCKLLQLDNEVVKSVATFAASHPCMKITIPFENGLIKVEFLSGVESSINIISDDKFAETIKSMMNVVLRDIDLEFDIDTIPETPVEEKKEVSQDDEKVKADQSNETTEHLEERNIEINDDIEIKNTEDEPKNEDNQAKKVDDESGKDEDSEKEKPSSSESSDDEDSDDDEQFMVGTIKTMTRTIEIDDDMPNTSSQANTIVTAQSNPIAEITTTPNSQTITILRKDENSISGLQVNRSHDEHASSNTSNIVIETENGGRISNQLTTQNSFSRDEASLRGIHVESGENYQRKIQIEASRLHQQNTDTQHTTQVQETEDGVMITHEVITTSVVETIEHVHSTIETVVEHHVGQLENDKTTSIEYDPQ